MQTKESQLRPRCGWTITKDETVLKVLRKFLPFILHLPSEAFFTSFDIAARVAAGFDSPESKEIIETAVEEAVKICISTYDDKIFKDDHYYMKDAIIEYIHGVIRRTDYFYDLLLNKSMMVVAFVLIIYNNAESKAFRSKYLEIDTPVFIASFFSSSSDRDHHPMPLVVADLVEMAETMMMMK